MSRHAMRSRNSLLKADSRVGTKSMTKNEVRRYRYYF